MRSIKGPVIAVEGMVLLALGAANIVSGQLLGGAIVVGLGALAAACAWALWPTQTNPASPKSGPPGLPRPRG
jgi:hypothetical protein